MQEPGKRAAEDLRGSSPKRQAVQVRNLHQQGILYKIKDIGMLLMTG